MKILLIEDMAGFADPMRQQFEACGHQVTWIIGAESVGAERLKGILKGKDAGPMTDEWDGDSGRLIDVVYADFELALVDGGLIGPVSQGSAFVKALAQAGVPVIGISGGGAGNPGLIAEGALVGMPKELVILALKAGVLDPADVVGDQDKERLSSRFDCFVREMREKAEKARAAKEKFDYGFPVLQSAS